MTILVTGGAGYIGSHVLKELKARGFRTVVLDNLSRGHRELAGDAHLVVGNINDKEVVRQVIREHGVEAVMHFAAFAYVGESVQHPAKYYENNVASSVALLNTMIECEVKKIVFSSTCATYGVPDRVPIDEDQPQNPVNAYGASKLMVERIIKDYETAYGMRFVIFRYFNAAGAHPSASIGERHDPETHLIPLALETAAGLRDHVAVFGTDYPTPDGTCVRDYIHVSDLADAHALGLQHLGLGKPSAAFNLGNGNGFSVNEVIDTAQRIAGRPIKRIESPRRAGDPPTLVGSARKARDVLGWSPKFTTLDSIVETAWKWHLREKDRITQKP
jgi:UDP-glucose 4-epimerase